jgi:6-phosphogluconolactonase
MRALAVLLAACGGGSQAVHSDAALDAGGDAAMPTHFTAYISGSEIAWFDVGSNGALAPLGHIAAFAPNPSFLAITSNRLYAVSEDNSRIGAYARDPVTGAITFIDDAASGGSGPAHLSVDRSGAWVFAANYTDGAIAVLPVRADGGVGAPTQTVAAGQNAHMIVSDAANRHVFVPCLGSDYVAQYDFDPATGTLAPNPVPHVATAAGAGPRHLAFAPDGTHAYLINENNSTLTALAYDATAGRLSPINTISTRPPDATSANTGAEVWVHPNGRFVYGSNRGDDTIAVFAVDSTGAVALIGQTQTQGQTPRMFGIDPLGRFLYAANQASNTVVPFAIDATTGALTPIAAPIAATTPQFVGIVARP